MLRISTPNLMEIPASCISGRNDARCVTQVGLGAFGFEGPVIAAAVDPAGDIYAVGVNSSSFSDMGVEEIPASCTSGGDNASCVTAIAQASNIDGVAIDATSHIYYSISGPSTVTDVQPGATSFGSEAVGSTSTANHLTFIFDSGGTIGAPVALTMGAAILRDRQRGQSLGQLASAYRVSRATIHRVLHEHAAPTESR